MRLWAIVTTILAIWLATAPAQAQNEHWSRQFAKPSRSTAMGPATGMSDGTGSPTMAQVKWHNGKLYMSGAWESGVEGADPTKQQRNRYWYMWSWSPVHGYEAIAHYHTAQGGSGPDGVINDFLWLPDGRLVVAGEFTRLDNPGGHRYHDVNALAVYDPKEPSANKWQPLGSVQYNGTVSEGGAIIAIAYDEQGNDLYIGGTFGGIGRVKSPKIHRYDFDTGSYEPMQPGVYGAKPMVERIRVDTSTTPSTIYVSGKFHYTSGDGINPENNGTSLYSTGFASWQEGAGWTVYPADHPTDGSKGKESGILDRAGDYARFDSVHVLDFLIDNGEIWIVGAFSEGQETGQTLRGIARWDPDKQVWTDPTGKGGVGRDVFSIAKAANGKYYFAGAFGGRRGVDEFIDGFKNGDPAHMVVSYDPASGEWAELGTGLSGKVLPEARLAVNGNDVYVVGDFQYVDPKNFDAKGDKKAQSWFIARWNEEIDFSKAPIVSGEVAGDTVKLSLKGGKGPFTYALDGGEPQKKGEFAGLAPGLHKVAIAGTDYAETVEVWIDEPAPAPQASAGGNEHWSRLYGAPERPKGGKSQMAGNTGMDDSIGAPTQINGLVKHEDALYFAGNWEAMKGERWYVWSWHRERGWEKLAWEGKDGITGPDSPPLGLKERDGKLYAYGAIAAYSGMAVYDIAGAAWSKFTGSFDGKEVVGNATLRGTGAINDIAWDSKTGDLYMVGSSGLELKGDPYPKDVGQVIRVDKDGNYHPMGHALKAEDPGKPVLGIYAVALDESQEPTAVYIGGTFNYYGPTPSTNERMAYNVARWDHEANEWGPIGRGITIGLSEIDERWYPDGLPGLPARPGPYSGFLGGGFPRIQALAVDGTGNLYAGGTLGLLDDALPVAERKEAYGIVKLDAETQTWVGVAAAGGVSRDVMQMTLIDDKTMLLSGGFAYDEQFNILNNVAFLDLETGELRPLGGGLMREGRDETISANVVHAVDGDDIYFAGFFDHAGANANSLVEAPIQANYVAHWNGTRSLDPNAGLALSPIEPVCEPKSATSSESRKVSLEAGGVDGKATITWYDRRSDGKFNKKGNGPKYTANLRVKRGDTPTVYVNVTLADGTEGGKVPVAIPMQACN